MAIPRTCDREAREWRASKTRPHIHTTSCACDTHCITSRRIEIYYYCVVSQVRFVVLGLPHSCYVCVHASATRAQSNKFRHLRSPAFSVSRLETLKLYGRLHTHTHTNARAYLSRRVSHSRVCCAVVVCVCVYMCFVCVYNLSFNVLLIATAAYTAAFFPQSFLWI